MTEGVININKPEGWTSADVVAKLRRLFNIKRIGHTGTLDPMATGVLPICIGRATRLIEYYDADLKTYDCSMKLGLVSDSLDNQGKIIETNSFSNVEKHDIVRCFKEYTGFIEQLPPKFSALKINGKRAYELAREGVDFELKKRLIYIPQIELKSIDLNIGDVHFAVECSKGTYVRTICDDIGKSLGCGAVMTRLCRISSGPFSIDKSHTIEELEKLAPDQRNALVEEIDQTLVKLGVIELDAARKNAFANGMTSGQATYRIICESPALYDIRLNKNFRINEISEKYRVYSGNEFIGIATLTQEKELKPEKVM